MPSRIITVLAVLFSLLRPMTERVSSLFRQNIFELLFKNKTDALNPVLAR